ncbi:hypothetical protein ACTXT7_007347 [Hymenolepis weldensis]
MLEDDTSSYWIGLFRNGSAHQWSNPAQPEVLFTNWMAGEPSGIKKLSPSYEHSCSPKKGTVLERALHHENRMLNIESKLTGESK